MNDDGKIHQHRACPRCGEDVEYGFGGPHAGAGVQMCIGCGAEVSFPSNPRDRGGRIVFADLAVPSQSGASPDGKHASCDNCGAEVPLRGLTHVEHTGVLEGDDADTVTCPKCGVETPAISV